MPKKMHMRRDYNMRLQSRSCWKSSTVTIRPLHSEPSSAAASLVDENSNEYD